MYQRCEKISNLALLPIVNELHDHNDEFTKSFSSNEQHNKRNYQSPSDRTNIKGKITWPLSGIA